jgi:hypothetical protein
VVLLAACGKGEQRPVAVADSTRDLQLAPVDTTAPLADVAAADTAPPAPVETVFVQKPAAPKPKPKSTAVAPAATASPNPAPAANVTRTLAAGTKFSGTIVDSIDSKTTKAGDVVKILVAEDVKDAEGRTVIPAGSSVSAEITSIKWSENKGDPGTLRFATGSVTVGEQRKAIVASVSKPEFLYRKRGGALGDASKVAGGAAAGAIIGGLLGKGTGAAVGGVLGGAVGTQRAIETKDRDIIVKPGSVVTVTLKEAFER